MLSYLLKSLILIALAAGVGWQIEGVTGAVGGVTLAVLWLFAGQLFQLARMLRWARQMPASGFFTPRAQGVWRDIYAALNKHGRQVIDQQQQAETALERFRQAAEAMPEGVIILDGERAIEWMNAQAQTCLNLSQRTDRGLAIHLLMREPEFLDYIAQSYPGRPLTLRSQRSPGRTLQIQLVPFAAGRSVMLVRDLTQIEKLEAMRRDFVANVSHELRTPLTVVAGFIEALQDNFQQLPPEQTARYLDLAAEQTRRMNRLVEDLLTLSTLETTGPREAERITVRPLLESVCAEARALSAGRHDIQLEISGPPTLMGSPAELHSAFGNLASNAVRYSPDGGRIILRWREERNGGARLEVSDEGLGIEAQHLPRLTERFYRIDRSRSRDTGGTGLGLAIVKHVLERHQARLEIASEHGKGSVFSAVFPQASMGSATPGN